MASIAKYPDSKYWIAVFRDASGHQFRRTTNKEDRKEAQKVADLLEHIAKGKGHAWRVRETINQFFKEHYKAESPFKTVRQYASEWLAPARTKRQRARIGDTSTRSRSSWST